MTHLTFHRLRENHHQKIIIWINGQKLPKHEKVYLYLNFPAKNERLHFGAKIQLKLFRCNLNTLYFDYFLFYFSAQIELWDKM